MGGMNIAVVVDKGCLIVISFSFGSECSFFISSFFSFVSVDSFKSFFSLELISLFSLFSFFL